MSRQTIYNRLRAAGIGEAGALALLGNWECESNCEPCRVQGDFTQGREKSRKYASNVDNGITTDYAFARDALGWGLAQWTYYTRKAALLEFCRRRSISIANEEAQVDFALQELRTEYGNLRATLASSGDLLQCVAAVCCLYERPAVNNIQARYEAALRIRDMIDTGDAGGGHGAPPAADNKDEEHYWPPRMLCLGMVGPDVTALRALLLAHGYDCGEIKGTFDEKTRDMVIAFQADNNLDPDSVAGPKTWGKLLEVET